MKRSHVKSGARRPYDRLKTDMVELYTSGPILVSSQTSQTMAPNSVNIDEYNPGFIDENDNEIGFDIDL